MKLIGTASVVAATDNGLKEAVRAEWFAGASKASSRVTCVLNVFGKEVVLSAKSSVQGYGYHKTSDALKHAAHEVSNREVQVGSGDEAIERAMTALARLVYPAASDLLCVRHMTTY